MSKKKIEQSVYRDAPVLLKEKGYISPVDLLVKMDRLTEKQVKDWRMKKISYLERVASGNLGKMNHLLKLLQRFAKEQNLKSSITVYKSWEKGPKQDLQFSKIRNPHMEKLHSTHYVRN
ncbi:hypothetical protein [Gracilibacillus kekensis]|uniref:Uncharacterized protein n=1 Tax=Gracilibacillus kekensis TaxID=1027249 RepID=A0A1M7QGF6_9BACI|nr:hypothetical protein [Gracilibacillus kekensis]SHN30049.1 hypothetical protein SAMN05216179_3132 [Gracilibacillus kekensis]